jgi:hypothetical protein
VVWHNNPEAVAAFHQRAMEDLYEARRRRTLLRLVRETGPDIRY